MCAQQRMAVGPWSKQADCWCFLGAEDPSDVYWLLKHDAAMTAHWTRRMRVSGEPPWLRYAGHREKVWAWTQLDAVRTGPLVRIATEPCRQKG